MNIHRFPIATLAVVAALLLACTTTEDEPAEEPATVSISSVVEVYLVDLLVQDATICADGLDEVDCVTSNAVGAFELAGIPVNTDVWLNLEMANYMNTYVAIPVAEQDVELAFIHVVSEELVNTLLSGVDTEIEPGNGQIVFYVGNAWYDEDAGVPDASVSLSPAAGEGPFYMGHGLLELELQATVGGFVTFANLPPGTYALSTEHPTMTCGPGNSWPVGSDPSVIEMVIRADALHQAAVVCVP